MNKETFIKKLVKELHSSPQIALAWYMWANELAAPYNITIDKMLDVL